MSVSTRLRLVCLATAAAALAPLAGAQAPDSALVFSCAAFPANLTEADLVRRFGAGAVQQAPVYGMDDGPVSGTIVHAADSARTLHVSWIDTVNRARPLFIKAVGSAWRTPVGVGVGMDLASLERRNGRPFRIAPFESEASGRVLSWGSGQLAVGDETECRLRIHIQPPRDGSGHAHIVRLRVPEFSSGHPDAQALNPRVVVMYLWHPRR